MKYRLYLFFIISSSLSNIYCNSDSAKQGQEQAGNVSKNIDKNYDELAKEYCQCSEEIINLNKKMQKMNEEGHYEDMGDLLSEIESKSGKQLACKEQLEQKYSTKIDSSAAVLSALKKNCPALGNFMENAKKATE